MGNKRGKNMNEKTADKLLDLLRVLIDKVNTNANNINKLAKESGLTLNDAEIIRTNSTGLVMYNPKNAAEMLKSMKNKSQSREQKIAERIAYQQELSQSVN